MRNFFICILLIAGGITRAQQLPIVETEYLLQRTDSKEFSFSLKKGYQLNTTVMQKGIDVEVIIHKKSDTARLYYMDSPNGENGPESIQFDGPATGEYILHVKPFAENRVSIGKFSIQQHEILSPDDLKKAREMEEEEENIFSRWVKSNATAINYVDAGNGFADLQPLKTILKDVQVVGLGESSHGTSEFFRMKHRLLEFLVTEMDYRSFYLEASMSRCRYINDYVLYGKGDLDTATVIQGFVTWRVEEFRDMIAWVRKYNTTIADDKKIKFLGYDLQINDKAWKELKDFYKLVKPSTVPLLDSMEVKLKRASMYSNSGTDSLRRVGAALFTVALPETNSLLQDITMNAGQYQSLTKMETWRRNWENIRLIIQEIESYKNGAGDRRDYYMAENILHLLQQERPGTKVVVWAHNGHIAKIVSPGYSTMGHWLDFALDKKYYALAFEFYSGSFQTRNRDINNWTSDWDVMSVGEPAKRSLPWYLDKTGNENLLLDFRYTGMDKIKWSRRPFNMHSFGSMYSTQWPPMQPAQLSYVDGVLYIRKSTAAKNFKKFYL